MHTLATEKCERLKAAQYRRPSERRVVRRSASWSPCCDAPTNCQYLCCCHRMRCDVREEALIPGMWLYGMMSGRTEVVFLTHAYCTFISFCTGQFCFLLFLHFTCRPFIFAYPTNPSHLPLSLVLETNLNIVYHILGINFDNQTFVNVYW